MKTDMTKYIADVIYEFITPEDWTQDELERLSQKISEAMWKKYIIFETAEDKRIQRMEADFFHRILTDYHYLLTSKQRENKLWEKMTKWREKYLYKLERV